MKLSNGESLTITEQIYKDAKRIYKWCKDCDQITEHLELPDYLKWPFKNVLVCNASKHTIKLEKGEPDDISKSNEKATPKGRRRNSRK